MRFLFALTCVLLGAVTTARAETFLILPFFNLSKNTNVDWIGDSLAETVRESLANEGALVLDRQSREEAYRRLSIRANSQLTKASIFVVGEALDATQVVYGSYELLPPPPGTSGRGNLRITAQILDLSKRSAGPEYLELGALEDLARLQAHLAWQTLQFLVPDTAPSEAEFTKRQPPVRVEAIENYTRGLLAANPEQKLKFLQQATQIEPNYSHAHHAMGDLLYKKKDYRGAASAFSKVSASDSHFREAQFRLGLCRYYLGEYDGAQMAFATVSDQVPLNEVYNNLGAAQARSKPAEALKNFEKALEGDTNDPDYHFNVGYALYRNGRLAEAADRFRSVLERVPGDSVATTMLGRCLKGNAPTASELRAAANLERVKETFEESAYRQLKAVLEVRK
jgi:tetratricopeptide (TPR) repeat protein